MHGVHPRFFDHSERVCASLADNLIPSALGLVIVNIVVGLLETPWRESCYLGISAARASTFYRL